VRSALVVICVITFIHYVGAQMRTPLMPLYAVESGATTTWVGVIIAAHMAAAAFGSIPLGRASDICGRRPLLLGGMALGVLTSLLLPWAERPATLAAIYGIAGVGVAAFTPSALALATDVAAPGRVGLALAWYTTAHYGAIGVGSFLGGMAAQWWGYGPAFGASAMVTGLALLGGLVAPIPNGSPTTSRRHAAFADVRGNAGVWAGWILAAGGMFTQGVVFTFFPLIAHERGLAPGIIGLVFLILGLANTLARFPAGWLMDRTGSGIPYAVAGVVVASIATLLIPHIYSPWILLSVVAVFGAVSGAAGVAMGVGLAGAAAPAARGVVMGGYSTSLYLGLALGSFALGPAIASWGLRDWVRDRRSSGSARRTSRRCSVDRLGHSPETDGFGRDPQYFVILSYRPGTLANGPLESLGQRHVIAMGVLDDDVGADDVGTCRARGVCSLLLATTMAFCKVALRMTSGAGRRSAVSFSTKAVTPEAE
jgi:predicted MFS family arabinose efflux permease